MSNEARSFGRVERELSDAERKLLRRRIIVIAKRRNMAFLRTSLISFAFCLVLCGLAWLASAAPPILLGALFGFLVIAIAAVAGSNACGDLLRIERSIESALELNRAEGVRVRSDAVVAFEESDDEGACHAFRVGENTVLFVVGHEFSGLSVYPNSDFSITTIRDAAGKTVEIRVARHGQVLTPVRTIGAEQTARLDIPPHLTLLDVSLDDIEQRLLRRGGPPQDIATSA